eukprot:EC785324.1.p3 GENE.EC785324.1~~EC785324.1.p3  ORF type:complete len:80 (-),score=21.75 EC785324.1:135-374(-)
MLTRKETVAVVHCCSNHPQQCGKEHANRSSTSTVDSTVAREMHQQKHHTIAAHMQKMARWPLAAALASDHEATMVGASQ